MYTYKSTEDKKLTNLVKVVVNAAADVGGANWLTATSAKRKFNTTLDPLTQHIDAQVQTAYQSGKGELADDNERLRNKISELTAKLALNKQEPTA